MGDILLKIYSVAIFKVMYGKVAKNSKNKKQDMIVLKPTAIELFQRK